MTGPLPPLVRYPVIVVLAGIGMVGLVVALHDTGWLPIAGPFVAVVVASVILYLVMWWRARRLRRLATDAADQLRTFGPAVADERARPLPDRASGATDESLAQADRQAAAALQRLAWGDERGATTELVGLADSARGWHADAPLTRQVATLTRTSAAMAELVRRMLAAAERRRVKPPDA